MWCRWLAHVHGVAVGRQQKERQCVSDFCRDNLLNKYGLPSMADGYLFALVGQVMKVGHKYPRLFAFGQLTGVVDPIKYTERAGDVYLALVKAMFPSFTANTFRSRRCEPRSCRSRSHSLGYSLRMTLQGRRAVAAS